MAMYEQQDWIPYRSLNTLPQVAGVPQNYLVHLLVKELVDNALDASGAAELGLMHGNGFFVADEGPGLPGGPQAIAALFSIARPLTSSKLLRLPTRGALGNGLRVVAGAVLATGGKIIVKTQGQVLHLCPNDNGT